MAAIGPDSPTKPSYYLFMFITLIFSTKSDYYWATGPAVCHVWTTLEQSWLCSTLIVLQLQILQSHEVHYFIFASYSCVLKKNTAVRCVLKKNTAVRCKDEVMYFIFASYSCVEKKKSSPTMLFLSFTLFQNQSRERSLPQEAALVLYFIQRGRLNQQLIKVPCCCFNKTTYFTLEWRFRVKIT